MAIYSAEPCWEVVNTAQSAIGLEGSGASVTLGCPYNQRFVVAQDMLANRRVFPGYGGTGAPRVADISMVGWGEPTEQPASSSQVLDYEEARLDVTYEPLAAIIPGDPGTAGYDLIVESVDQAIDGLRLSHNGFSWATDATSLKPGEAPSRQVTRMTFTREFIGLAVIPTAAWAYAGKTNIAAFTSTLFGHIFGIETLLFGGMPASRTIRTDGSDGWNVKFTWHYKQEGWNNFWRFAEPDGGNVGGYDQIVEDSSGINYNNYPPVDMSALLF